jgi:tRNA (guanine37-N1)-methyltransferase
LLAPPVYTRPEVFREWGIPDVLKSGNHKLIDEWRHEQAVQRTKERRPDLLD